MLDTSFTLSLVRNVYYNFFLLLCALVGCAVVLEVLLRLLGIGFPYFSRVDPDMGFSLRPFASGEQHQEGHAFIRINSDGLRDREHTLDKPRDTIRIAVLGDSYAEARQVDREETFWSHLERDLASCDALAGRSVEVLNFGVSGYGTTQEYQMLQSKVWKYDPDIVLLAFTTGNDVRNNSLALEGNTQKPYHVYRDGALILDLSFRERDFFRFQQSPFVKTAHVVINHSRVLQVINRAYSVWKGRNVLTARSVQQMRPLEQQMENAVYGEPETEEWREAWEITEDVLRLIASEARVRDAQFLLMTLSNPLQLFPEKSVREAVLRERGIPDFFYPERRLQRLAEGENFPILTLAPKLQRMVDEEDIVLHGFDNTNFGKGHWNEEGHRRAAELMVPFVCEALGTIQ